MEGPGEALGGQRVSISIGIIGQDTGGGWHRQGQFSEGAVPIIAANRRIIENGQSRLAAIHVTARVVNPDPVKSGISVGDIAHSEASLVGAAECGAAKIPLI